MNRVRHSGFTLIEMMVAMVVLAILIAAGGPAFNNLIKNNRMLSDVYALRAALNGARSEALAQRRFVTFCASTDGAACDDSAPFEWEKGYIAFTDLDGDAAVDAGDGDEVIVAKVIDSDQMEVVKYSGGFRVRFDARGYARGFQGTFTVCDDRGAEEARGMIVTAGGVVRAAVEDPDDPGIARDLGGAKLVCP